MLAILLSIFSTFFADSTLRIDYTLAGDTSTAAVYVDQVSLVNHRWAGRTNHLDIVPLAGNGEVTVRNVSTGATIYRTTFSSLFQEWILTEEATRTSRSFEHSMLIPYPRHAVEVELTLFDNRRNIMAATRHVVDPQDILIARPPLNPPPHKYLHRGDSLRECIDIAILAEGYTIAEMDSFYRHAEIAVNSLFTYEPFRSLANRFNVVAVASPSRGSGVSVPRLGTWKQTAFSSHFSTFYSDRYLTSMHIKDIHNALCGIDYEHIIILANTDEYGGGGIYNNYTLTAARNKWFRPVVVHEFGHSFAGLADEYFYDDDVMTDTTPLDIEPWEPNVSIQQDTLFQIEGGAYSSHGVWRAEVDCRMRTNTYHTFCRACQMAIRKLIDFYTE